jgi:hypothetical protein
MNIRLRFPGHSQPEKPDIFIDFKKEKYESSHENDFMRTDS